MFQLVPFQRSASVPVWLPWLSAVLPTAVQLEADGQAMLFRKLPCAPVGLGVGWMLHLVPFQRSTTAVALPELSVDPPTAMHAAAEVHATPCSRLLAALAGFGVGWMLQWAPFQRSASVFVGMPELSVVKPTAVQAEADMHATALSRLPGTPAGFGVGWILHLVPFQRSASVAVGFPARSDAKPTAVQTDPDWHATAVRMLPLVPAGFGVRTMLHRVPFQRSARVPSGLPTGPALTPTAVQVEADRHATPLSTLG